MEDKDVKALEAEIDATIAELDRIDGVRKRSDARIIACCFTIYSAWWLLLWATCLAISRAGD